MTNFIKFVLVITFIVLCLCSCEKIIHIQEGTAQREETTPKEEVTLKDEATTENIECYFNSISDLLKSIKYDPYKYANKEVQVKGTLIKQEEENILALVELSVVHTDVSVLDGYIGRYHYRNDPCIDIIITDELLYTVSESGDYLTVCGIVRISDGEIYLDGCSYTYD